MQLHRTTSRRGILLIECMIYLTITLVIIGLAFAIFYQCQTQSVHLRRQSEHVSIAMRFGERWRSETRLATAAPFVKEEAGSVFFHIPQKEGEIIYLWDGMHIWRKDASDNKFVVFVESIRHLEFLPEERHLAKGWRLELELESFQKNPTVKPLFSFLSVNSI